MERPAKGDGPLLAWLLGLGASEPRIIVMGKGREGFMMGRKRDGIDFPAPSK